MTTAQQQKPRCALCERERVLTFHHLIPKKTHKRTYVRNRFTKEQCNTMGIMLCTDCHHTVHKRIGHRDLAETYNSLEKIREHPEIIRFVNWVAKQHKKVKKR